MTKTVTAFVLVALVFAIALGISGELDRMGIIILGLVVAVGALSVAVARRAEGGSVSPAMCGNCGGLISPNAPYCKHCGATVQRERD